MLKSDGVIACKSRVLEGRDFISGLNQKKPNLNHFNEMNLNTLENPTDFIYKD